MIRRPPRSTQSRSSAASDVYKRQVPDAGSGTGARGYGGTRPEGQGRHGTSVKHVSDGKLEDVSEAHVSGPQPYDYEHVPDDFQYPGPEGDGDKSHKQRDGRYHPKDKGIPEHPRAVA